MRTRSNGSVYNQSITRRTARLALAIALSSGAWPNAWAEHPLPTMPAVNAEAVTEGTGLLPYPFGAGVPSDPSLEQAGSVTQADTLGRSAASRQLVQLLGLRQQALENGSGNPVELAQPGQPQLPTLPQFNASLPAAKIAAPEVIAASATDQQLGAGKLPKSSEPAKATGDGATHEQMCELLLDIQIPTSVAIDSPPLIKDGPGNAGDGLGSTKKMGNIATESRTRDGVVQACEAPSLLGSEPIQPPRAKSAMMAKQPELLRLSKPLSVAAGKSAETSGPVTFNLNDDADETARGTASNQNLTERKAQSGGRAAVLHLSSGSDDVTIHQAAKTTTSGLRTPKPTMQVRIEGEPAPALAGLAGQAEALVRSAAPLPLMESGSFPSSVTTASRSAVPQTFDGMNSAKPVKALLAVHTASVASAGEGTSASSLPSPASSLGLVSLGLQESQAISIDYAISELSVEHPGICQLLRTSDRSVSVIGMRVGTTRIALISTDANGERRIEVRDVAVNADARGEVNLVDLAGEISQTVNQLYPKSDVQIVVHENRLMVRGYTNYESDAKKILALVRKTSLAPVVDQLTTSGN